MFWDLLIALEQLYNSLVLLRLVLTSKEKNWSPWFWGFIGKLTTYRCVYLMEEDESRGRDLSCVGGDDVMKFAVLPPSASLDLCQDAESLCIGQYVFCLASVFGGHVVMFFR